MSMAYLVVHFNGLKCPKTHVRAYRISAKKIQGRNIGIPVLKGREGVKGSGILGQKMKSKGWKLDRD